MSTDLTVGELGTYTRAEFALAALTFPLTDDTRILIGTDTGGVDTYYYTVDLVIPPHTNYTKYTLTIETDPTLVAAGTKIKFDFSGTSTKGIDSSGIGDNGFILNNLKIEQHAASGDALYLWTNPIPTVKGCEITSADRGISIRAGLNLIGCTIDAPNDIAIAASSGNAPLIQDCVIKSKFECISGTRPNGVYSRTTFMSTGYFAIAQPYTGRFKDCAFISELYPTFSADPSSTFNRTTMTFENCHFDGYNGLCGPTELQADFIANNPCTVSNTTSGDAKVAGSGVAAAYAVPDSDSPLRASNRVSAESPVYTDQYIMPNDVGGWSDYTAISQDDIIKSAGGNYNDDNLIPENVKALIAYGIAEEGTYDPTGTPPTAATISGVSVGDGSITVTYIASSETDTIYARYRRNSPAYGWVEKSESFKRVGSGAITITGLINGIEYEVSGQSITDLLYGDFSNSYFAAPDSDAFATSRYNGKINRRNRTALAALQVCQRLGVKIDFTNIQGSTSVNIYAMVDEAATSTIGVRTGDIDGSAVVLIVPRQTNFPPEKILPNSIITLNTKVYQIDRWSSDVEDINMASTWKLYCSVSGDCYGY